MMHPELYQADPSQGSRVVECSRCGTRGSVTESGSPLDSTEHDWEVLWERGDRCPASADAAHRPVPLRA